MLYVSPHKFTVEPPIGDPLRQKGPLSLPTKDTLLDPFPIAVVHGEEEDFSTMASPLFKVCWSYGSQPSIFHGLRALHGTTVCLFVCLFVIILCWL